MKNFRKRFNISVLKRLPFRIQPFKHFIRRKARKNYQSNKGKNPLIGAIMAIIILGFSTTMASGLPVTSNFGWRVHPISGEYKFHAGVDLGYEYGTNVPALFPGQVIMAGNYDDGYGIQCLMYHPEIDAYTRYCHMMDIAVGVGDMINAGTIIGHVGSSGNSTGPHLHLEYIIPDGNGGYVYTNPLVIWEE